MERFGVNIWMGWEDIMILRDFKKEDAKIIAGWLRSEEELYRWLYGTVMV